jgi:hypothetical protein
MNPCELFAEIGNILTGVVKKPYRDEPVTPEEFDQITDQILMLAEEQKHGRRAQENSLRTS